MSAAGAAVVVVLLLVGGEGAVAVAGRVASLVMAFLPVCVVVGECVRDCVQI